jgi:rhodanese-related sulfurtransferase
MSPDSARRAEILGYTNVKVYHDGVPEWIKRNYLVLSTQFLKDAWIEKDIPHVLVDVRPIKDAEAGFIKGAVSIPAADIEKSIAKFPPKDKKAPIMVYDQKGGDDAMKAAKTLIAAGYAPVDIVSGGFAAWKAAGFPIQTGKLAEKIVYVPKPRPGEISIDDFKKIAANTPADTLILDVRNRDEGNAGMIKGAKLLPDEEILDRLAEIPKDKKIVTHCSTGVRAEMAYHKLKEKGYNVQFLNAKVEIDKDGNFKIEKP